MPAGRHDQAPGQVQLRPGRKTFLDRALHIEHDVVDRAGVAREQRVAEQGLLLAPDLHQRRAGDGRGVGEAVADRVPQVPDRLAADVVLVEGRPCAKAGRMYRPNPRLEAATRATLPLSPRSMRLTPCNQIIGEIPFYRVRRV